LLSSLLAGICLGAPPDDAEIEEREKEEYFRLPVLLDGYYNWRFNGDSGWHGLDAMIRFRLDDLVFRREARTHEQFALTAFWETGYRFDPNPTRVSVMAGYSWGRDYHDYPTANDWNVTLSRLGGFPLTRSDFLTYNFMILGGFHSSRGTRPPDGRLESQDALRFEFRGHIGWSVMQFEARLALHAVVRDGRFFDGEVYGGIIIGRPFLPGGIRVGYSYLGFERGGGGYVVLGIHLAF
jgi:hypothetical protein